MKVLIPGHVYEVGSGAELHFLKRTAVSLALLLERHGTLEITPPDATATKTLPGTTNEEMLEVLIDRTTWLDEQFPCVENQKALEHLRGALEWFNARTAKRVAQGVEGQAKNHT